MSNERKFRNQGGLSFDHLLAFPVSIGPQSGWVRAITLVDSYGVPLDNEAGDGLRVFVTNPSSGGAGGGGDVNVTDRAGRILGRAGVDILTSVPITADVTFPAVQAISATSLPLPGGAATEATLATLATDAGLASVYGRLGDGSVRVGGTVAISAVALPLPAGAATDAGLSSVYARLGDGSAHVAVDSLPIGLATSAKQDTGNASVASIDTKTPALVSGRVPVDGSGVTQPVSGPLTDAQLRATAVPVAGTFWQAVQPVSGPLTDAQLRASSVPVSGPLTDAQLRATALPVSGTFWQATQPISAAALPLPAGASTEATLALIKAKTDNLDVALSTRAVTGLTDAQLRASAVPVSGTVTANIGTTNGLALDATLTGGTQKAVARGGAKGATAAADLTSTAEGADHQALDVQIYHGGVAKDPTAVRALTSADVVTAAQGTAAGVAAPWPFRLSDGAAFYDALKTGQLPAALVGGRLDGNIGAWLGSTAPTVGQKTMANAIPIVIASDQSAIPVSGPLTDTQLRATAVPVSAPTLTKGTQGANGFSVQPLCDAGRTKCLITFRGTGAVADALLSLVKVLGSTAAGGATSIAVTAGKTLRITGALFSVKANAAAAAFARYTLRHNSGGAALIGSTDIFAIDLGLTAATVGSVDKLYVPFEGGLEFSGTDQIAISAAMQATTNIIAITLVGFEF